MGGMLALTESKAREQHSGTQDTPKPEHMTA